MHEQSAVSPGAAPASVARRSGLLSVGVVVTLAVAIATGLVLPAVVPSVLFMTLMTQAVINGVLATGVGFLVKQNGVVSFGHAAFFGLAAYTIALSMKYRLMPPEAAIILALVVPVLLALLLGLVIMRIPGVAFSMLTLAVGQALFEVVLRWRELANGEDGLAIKFPAEVFGVAVGLFQNPHRMFLVCWIALVLVMFGIHVLTASRFGRLTEAIRENEERARFIGYRTVVPRALVYAVSALVAAVAGVLFALYNAFVSPDALHWSLSGSALIMAIIGGPRLLWGPAFGAVIFFFFKDLAGDFSEHWPAMIGVTLIVVTVLLPEGAGGALARSLARLRARPVAEGAG